MTPGAVVTVPNTITTQVTVVLGVTSVNNPTAASVTGVTAESDQNLRVRRQASTAISSQGYFDALYAALNNINGVQANIYENDTGFTVDTVPEHSIWVIVGGSGSPAAIANAIYTKRNAGCGMKGSQSYAVTQADGSTFTVYWDDLIPENVFISLALQSINGTTPPNIAGILTYLDDNLTPNVNTEINITGIGTLVQDADPNSLVAAAGISNGQSQTAALSGVAASERSYSITTATHRHP